MTALYTPESPSLEIPPAPSERVNWLVVASQMLVFASTVVIAFFLLRIFFAKPDTTQKDNTVGQVNAFQCSQLNGKPIILENGHTGCKVEGVAFSLSNS